MKKLPPFKISSFLVGFLIVMISCGVFYSFGGKKPGILATIDYRIMDTMFQIRGSVKTSGQVVIVDIDEKSLNHLGQWPWPRVTLADLTTKLIDHKAKAVGFDVVFAEKDRASPNYYFQTLPDEIRQKLPEQLLSSIENEPRLDYDNLFAEALSKGPTVLGYVFNIMDDGLKDDMELPFPSGQIKIHPPGLKISRLNLYPAYRAVVNTPAVAMAETEGFFTVLRDESGVTRRVPLFMRMNDIPYPSLALETFRIGSGIDTTTIWVSEKIKRLRPPIIGVQLKSRFIPTDEQAQLFVNYRGPMNTFPYIPAIDILNLSRAEEVKDKFVLIGSSAKGLYDLRATPYTSASPGVEIHANVIDNLIEGDPFVHDFLTEMGMTYTFILAGGLSISLLLSILGPLSGNVIALLLLSGSTLFNYHYYFLNQRYVGMTYPLVTCLLILFIISIFNAIREQKSRRFIRKAFSHYVSKDVVTEMIKNPKALSLKGEEKELTVLFSDIRDFTAISESMPSQALAAFMNDYLSRMSRIIIRNKGTVDKFIGDAVMAFWGAPKNDPSHAENAVLAAIEMKNETEKLRAEYGRHNLPDIYIGIGVNTGLVSVGNFGSNERFDYTVMGDNVNLASRLEGANKNYGTTILLSDTTKKSVEDKFFFRFIDKVQVKGRTAPVDIYEPVSIGEPDAETKAEVTLFESGITAYQYQEFQKARTIMKTLIKKNPHQLYRSYLDRIDAFLATPPPKEWSGAERRSRLPVNKLTTK